MLNSRQKSIANRTVWTLFTAQCFGSAGFLIIATISTIVGAKLTGSAQYATVPGAIYQLGISAAAFGWGYGMDRLGRRGGLALGLALGVVGALLAGYSVIVGSLLLFIIGTIFMGMANSALQLARFAAAEVHTANERGRAISNVVIGGTVSAIFWFIFSDPIEKLLEGMGIDPLTWPYLVSAVMFIVATIVLFAFLRPDPRDFGREIASLEMAQSPIEHASRPARSISEIIHQPAVLVAVGAMVFGQVVMIMLMVITSLHMQNHDHNVAAISKVISVHVIGMFAFSIVSGRLADRFGRGPVILVGAATLIVACLIAPLSPDILPMGIALFLLGLGWNFCYVGGSSLLSDQLSPDERARTQGFNDLLIGLVSAVGSLGSGFVFAAVGFGVMGLVGAIVAIVPLALTLWWQATKPALAVASP